MSTQQSTLAELVSQNRSKKIEGFSADGKLMFNLLALIVDIHYRQDKKKSFDYNNDNNYSGGASNKTVLADKIPPVDNGLLGRESTGDICL